MKNIPKMDPSGFATTLDYYNQTPFIAKEVPEEEGLHFLTQRPSLNILN